jgi:hypothetical protein
MASLFGNQELATNARETRERVDDLPYR